MYIDSKLMNFPRAPASHIHKAELIPPKSTSIMIRHAEPDDYEALHQLFIQSESIYQASVLPFASMEQTYKRLVNKSEGYYTLVACGDDTIVGTLALSINIAPRLRHVARLGLVIVHPACQGRGIGSKLMSAALNLADNWLNIHRLELLVYSDNERAIALYRKFGFTVEGALRNLAFQAGQCTDVQIMSRIRTM